MSINKYDSTTGDLIPIHSGEVMYADSPIGTILSYGGTTAPNGFLLCNGAAVSRTTYGDLFAVIGTSYGAGDGSTTFNVPNLQGKVAVGYSGGEIEFNSIGKTGGEKTHTLIVDEIPAHSHPTPELWVNYQTGGANDVGASTYRIMRNGNVATSTYNTGGGGAHNNLQPYVVTNYIIKAKQTPMPADMQGEVDDINGEITQMKSDLDGTKQPIGTITLTLATGNGTKTVAQIMNEGFATLTAYRPSANGATHFRIESFDAPIGGAGVIKKLTSCDRNIVSAFTDTLVDAGTVAPRADGMYGFGARIQSTGSMLKRIGVSTSSVASYVDWSTNTVDNNIKFTALITLYKSF